MKTIAVIGNQAFSLVNFRGRLICDLVGSGMRVLALAPDFSEETRAAVIASGAVPVEYHLSRVGMNPLRDAADFFYLVRLLRRLQPDVVLSYSIKPVIYGMLAAWLAGVPRRFAMIEGLGFVFTDSVYRAVFQRRLLRGLVSLLYRISLAMADGVFFLNQDDIEEFVQRKLVCAQKVCRINGTGVDLDEWRSAPPVLEPVCFLLAARLLREKGILEFVEAARRIKKIHPYVRFVLLGGLDQNPGGFSRAEAEGWVREGVIEWPGHVDIKPWLARASVFVLPSYYREGLPRSTQEAMAMARPVITTDAPGCRETVVDGENGFLVPIRDVGALVEKMLKFIENRELITKMGKKSRELAEARFDVRKINADIMRVMNI